MDEQFFEALAGMEIVDSFTKLAEMWNGCVNTLVNKGVPKEHAQQLATVMIGTTMKHVLSGDREEK